MGNAFAAEISIIGYSVSISLLSLSHEVRIKAVTQKNASTLIVGILIVFIVINMGYRRSVFRTEQLKNKVYGIELRRKKACFPRIEIRKNKKYKAE